MILIERFNKLWWNILSIVGNGFWLEQFKTDFWYHGIYNRIWYCIWQMMPLVCCSMGSWLQAKQIYWSALAHCKIGGWGARCGYCLLGFRKGLWYGSSLIRSFCRNLNPMVFQARYCLRYHVGCQTGSSMSSVMGRLQDEFLLLPVFHSDLCWVQPASSFSSMTLMKFSIYLMALYLNLLMTPNMGELFVMTAIKRFCRMTLTDWWDGLNVDGWSSILQNIW